MELKPCPWCGSKLEVSSPTSFMCANDSCLLANHGLNRQSWENSYCHKELSTYKSALAEARIGFVKIYNSDSVSYSAQICHENLKSIDALMQSKEKGNE